MLAVDLKVASGEYDAVAAAFRGEAVPPPTRPVAAFGEAGDSIPPRDGIVPLSMLTSNKSVAGIRGALIFPSRISPEIKKKLRLHRKYVTSCTKYRNHERTNTR
jgi:hypothetical protein